MPRAHDRAAIEKALGMPWLDFMFDAYVQTGSVKRAAKMLIDESGYFVSADVVGCWWTDAVKADPSLWTAAILARAEQVGIDEAVARGLEVEANGVRRECGLVRAALGGHHCKVCGAPAPPDRETTCEARCAELWQHHRYHINEDARAKWQLCVARWTIAHKEKRTRPQVAYSERLLAGAPTREHGRWITSDDVWIGLVEVEARRKAAKAYWGDMAADLPEIAALA